MELVVFLLFPMFFLFVVLYLCNFGKYTSFSYSSDSFIIYLFICLVKSQDTFTFDIHLFGVFNVADWLM